MVLPERRELWDPPVHKARVAAKVRKDCRVRQAALTYGVDRARV